jgi:tetratricopeptide (TPR) repeat protein
MGDLSTSRRLLETARITCEDIAKVDQNITNDIPTLCRRLMGGSHGITLPSLPTLYAATLYHLGRLYFYNKNITEFGAADKCLKDAVAIRTEIDADKQRNTSNKVGYEDSNVFNEQNVDSLIFKQQGTLYMLIEPYYLNEANEGVPKTKHRKQEDYKKAIKEYQILLKGYPKDIRSQITCHHQLANIHQKLANLTWSSLEKEKYYKEAICHIDATIDRAKQVTPAKLSDYYITKALINIDINTKDSIDQASDILHQVLDTEMSKNDGRGSRNSTMADTYKGLAKVYLKRGLYEEARIKIEECIQIQQEMKRSDKHPDLFEAKALRKDIVRSAHQNVYSGQIGFM